MQKEEAKNCDKFLCPRQDNKSSPSFEGKQEWLDIGFLSAFPTINICISYSDVDAHRRTRLIAGLNAYF